MTRDDLLCYLDKCRKPENEDPLHKRIGTYNTTLTILSRFFKWLHYPDVEDPKKRSEFSAVERKPECIMLQCNYLHIVHCYAYAVYVHEKRPILQYHQYILQ